MYMLISTLVELPGFYVPDNLKTGVSKNTRCETILNKSYAEMAEYYETAIVPARVRAPQDKSLAEGTIKFATTWDHQLSRIASEYPSFLCFIKNPRDS